MTKRKMRNLLLYVWYLAWVYLPIAFGVFLLGAYFATLWYFLMGRA